MLFSYQFPYRIYSTQNTAVTGPTWCCTGRQALPQHNMLWRIPMFSSSSSRTTPTSIWSYRSNSSRRRSLCLPTSTGLRLWRLVRLLLIISSPYNAHATFSIVLGTLGYADYMDRAMGLLTPWSFVPHPILLYVDEMSFSQRCYNFLISTTDALIRKYYYLPRQDKLAKKYFASIEG